MEKIKLSGSDQVYEIRSISPIAAHILQIVFADAVPESWSGDIELYTAGDVLATILTGWTTVYRDEGQTVYMCHRRIQNQSLHQSHMYRHLRNCKQPKSRRLAGHASRLSIPVSV